MEELKTLVFKEIKSKNTGTQIHDTKEGLEHQIRHRRKLADDVNTALYAAMASKEDWKEDRSQGLRRAGTGIQTFATNLGKVLDRYSGIVNLIQIVGGPYGAAGYSALSCLLTVSFQPYSTMKCFYQLVLDRCQQEQVRRKNRETTGVHVQFLPKN